MMTKAPSHPLAAPLLVLAFLAALTSAGHAADTDLLKPLRTDTPPKIDGILDDPVWDEAPTVSGFETFIPEFGKVQPEQTVVYMAYDRENLYFGFRCFDDQPDKIKAAVSQRDSVQTDDFVCVNLDTFNDQQSLYALYVNPLGIQADSRFAGNREDFSVDVVWYSAGRIDEKGYAVEMQIPLKSVRFSSGDRVLMSVFFERTISRRMEHGSYPPLDPKRGYAFLTQMAPMEYLGLKRYTLLEILPAVTYSRRYAQSSGRLDRTESLGELSLTGKYGITPSLILDGTINPDFSQIEADAGQVDVNLRYDLFYPEKRPFFLEGSENFNVGATQDNSIRSFVHTRTIIDPTVGFKLSGKIGSKDTIASILAVDSGSPDGMAGEDSSADAVFSILRYKRTISQDGYLGLLYTGRERGSGFNRVIGPDGQIRLHESGMLSFHAFGSFTRTEGGVPDADGHTLGLEYRYDTDRLLFQLGGQDTSRGFQVDTGYVTRTGLSRFFLAVTPKFYPESSILRRIDPLLETSHLRDHESGLFETSNSLGLNMILKGNTIILVGGLYSTEIFLGRRFLTGGLILNARSQISKKLSTTLVFNTGKAIRYAADPFQGRGTRARISLVYLPQEKFNLTFSLTYADLYRDSDGEKIYDYTIGRGRLTYQVNKYLFFRGVLEYNSYRRQMLSDLLASFTYIPGTVIQLGYGSLYEKIEWRQDRYVDSDRFLETRRGLFFKVSYLWRL